MAGKCIVSGHDIPLVEVHWLHLMKKSKMMAEPVEEIGLHKHEDGTGYNLNFTQCLKSIGGWRVMEIYNC